MPDPSTSGGTRHPRVPDQKGDAGMTAAFLSSGSTTSSLREIARNIATFVRGSIMQYYVKKRSSSNNTEPKRENSVLHSTVGHDNDTNHIGLSYANSKTLKTVMQVVKTKIHGVGVNVMFDSGADRSFVTKTCGDKLGLRNMDAFAWIPFEEDYGKGRSVKIDILIGLDNYWALMKNNCLKSTSGLVAQETAFGWMLSGVWYNDRSRSEQNHDQSMNNASKTRSLFCQTEMAVSETEVRRIWDLDSIGIGPEQPEDDKMLDNFNKEIKWNGERYTVKLPWRDTSCKETLMNNKTQALGRLNSLSKKLNKNPDMKARYDAVLEDLQKNGIIGEIQNQKEETSNPTFYLPHRPVVREASTSTTVRPGFDASCKGENGISLNDCMNSNPNLIPNLAQTLLRFRRWRTRTVEELTNNLYVDDWLTGADTEQELMNLKTEATQILNEGGFPLAKWTSNSGMMRESVSKSFNEHVEVPCTKILGISWITDEDSFSFETF
ncbi:hypothetical protein RRG08_043209 [Elysia crispata]|uniref:Peptidase aspartic putative domain-containing protein n=1 Tax=Elysia crispata TaxID=231223 RepID=A0AAE0ZJS4_9GAST|nr:hypothetical protein RRG08_043209 [Elysia crispata]